MVTPIKPNKMMIDKEIEEEKRIQEQQNLIEEELSQLNTILAHKKTSPKQS